MMKVTKIAELCHEVNKAYCDSLGDFSQEPWEQAPEWKKESAIKGVIFCLHTETSPADLHNSWLKQKEADGWVYGPVKDIDRKEHPCFLPFEQLPKDQKSKDSIFKAICDFYKKIKKSDEEIDEETNKDEKE